MKVGSLIPIILLFFSQACAQETKNTEEHSQDSIASQQDTLCVEDPNLVCGRFKAPKGYKRLHPDSGSFAFYLQHLPLKPEGSVVTTYDGRSKINRGVYAAVVDLPIGNKDLHQCADAVMRLRADHLRAQEHYDSIHFNFTNGFNAQYSRWLNGERIKINGNNVYWQGGYKKDSSDASYWKYLEMVFSYAGTLSLSKELKATSLQKLKIGDVFIKGGSPGHAVIVVDMAVDTTSGKKVYMLAQSYMPAQEIQILINPLDESMGVWYELNPFDNMLPTPEWMFDANQVMSF